MIESLLVGKLAELEKEGSKKVIKSGNIEIGIFRRKGKFYAYENMCKHQGGPVCEGIQIGKTEVILTEDKRVVAEVFSEDIIHIVCPWHGWEYSLDTGQCISDRRLRLKSFEVIVKGDELYVVV